MNGATSSTAIIVEMFAYFDAGTGSMILSAVAAGAAGIAIAGKSVWYKIAFWRKDGTPRRGPAADTGDVDIDVDPDAADGLDVGEIDDAELEIN